MYPREPKWSPFSKNSHLALNSVRQSIQAGPYVYTELQWSQWKSTDKELFQDWKL